MPIWQAFPAIEGEAGPGPGSQRRPSSQRTTGLKSSVSGPSCDLIATLANRLTRPPGSLRSRASSSSVGLSGEIWATTLRSPAFLSELRVASHPSRSPQAKVTHFSELVHRHAKGVHHSGAASVRAAMVNSRSRCAAGRGSQNLRPSSWCRPGAIQRTLRAPERNPQTIRPEPDVQSRSVCGCRGAACDPGGRKRLVVRRLERVKRHLTA